MGDISIPQFRKMLGIGAHGPFWVFDDEARDFVLLAKSQPDKRFSLVLAASPGCSRFGQFVIVLIHD